MSPTVRTPPGDWSKGPTCPACGAARITSAAEPCWLCGEKLPEHDGPLPRGRRPLALRGGETKYTKGNNVFLIIMGGLFLCVFLLSMTTVVEAPGFAILLGIVALPCLFRTLYVESVREKMGAPYSGGQWLRTFLAYLGVVMLVAVAAGAAFFVTCAAICFATFR
ncbi:MAG: hypothetical protein L0215_12840 [Gemmataceae bacterium]|nr:hypothetical protein [Gemmataceae bacterium]